MGSNSINISEKRIIKLLYKGDKNAFKYLFDNYYHRLYLYAKSYIDESNTAEDIVQDLFFRMWEKRKTIMIASSLSSYLFRAVHNRCIQYFRHKSVVENFNLKQQLKSKEAKILYNAAGDYSFSELEFNEISEIIEETLKHLPDKTKEVFLLSREKQLTNKEVAIKLDLSIKTVEYHISSALKTFREALKDHF